MASVRNLYVIYYGWLIDDPSGAPNAAARAIAAARPQALLASFYTFEPKYTNLSPQVRALLREAGARVFAYVTTSYATRPLRDVKAEAREYLRHGVDGIFFDEMCNFIDEEPLAYCRDLHALVKRHGKDLIMNTGVAEMGEAIMSVTDIAMVEHQWRSFYQANPWRRKYPPERFMGDSSNEPGADEYLGGVVTPETAIRDTREAWANGIGWHYSTDEYTTLPVWFDQYIREIGY